MGGGTRHLWWSAVNVEVTPTPETQPFWDGALAGELRVQRCQVCRRRYFYPRPFCPSCHSTRVAWEAVSGRATLYSYVINHQPVPGCEDDLPYVIAVVTLAEGPRMMSNVVGVDPVPEALELDMALEVVFEGQGAWKVPRFTPVDARGGAPSMSGRVDEAGRG